ncbi:ABC transporter ATP-binding protein [Marinococcus halophilus]|uniref:Putative ABC transporter ATP-binding protein YfiB n=1 Tax=Marinococcus halophilus TaxID=1371 RepID=A0A510Y8R5_MARHA|nr:ABC transporter ATP-binding protein [Marinococcus halophilus]OZT79213.1 ABC transporter ATP-binding protein [Marinococcus halophilus]GEK59774.1 putative ABC transporter ATP-binding protein YfiB [Marinococcus halophilus]
MKTILRYVRPYKAAAVLSFFLLLIELSVELFQPLLLARLIDEGLANNDLGLVVSLGLSMAGLALLSFGVGVLNCFFADHVGHSTGFDLRNEMYKRLQESSLEKLQGFPQSSLLTRLTNDITQVQNMIVMLLRFMLRSPLLLVGATIMAFVVNARMALILVVFIPFLLLILAWLMRKGMTYFGSLQQRIDAVNRVMKENLGGLRLVRVFGREQHEIKRFFMENEALQASALKAFRYTALTSPILLFLMNAAIVLMLWIGGAAVQNNEAQVGEVVAVVNYATRMTGALGVVGMLITLLARARTSASRIEEVLEGTEKENSGQYNVKDEGSIDVQFENVTFAYNESRVPALNNVTFHVKRGEQMAVLGATGAGKSSLFQLMLRLYEPASGQLLIDDSDARELNITSLRNQIGYVPQEAKLFSGTIRENVEWGLEGAETEEINKALETAQLGETVRALPEQEETLIGQNGVNLSGGQKQRVTIARALLRNPGLLLLDDSTSALDAETEAEFLGALEAYSCTSILVTQKLSTALKADKMLLLEHGEVIGFGTHEELYGESAFYRQLYQSQYGKEAAT